MSGAVFDDDTEFDDGTGWLEHEPPFADPAIREQFTGALGAFILLFNEADYFVGQILSAELKRIGRPHLYDPANNFSSRLSLVEALSPVADNLRGLPFSGLREMAAMRNTLAHGHFDQNLFGGDYKLILRNKYRDISTETVLTALKKLGGMVVMLRVAHVPYDFM